MRATLLLFLSICFWFDLAAQQFEQRQLRPIQDGGEGDSLVLLLKRDRNGEIKKLEQSYWLEGDWPKKGTKLIETYKRDSYWYVNQYYEEEIWKSPKKGQITYKMQGVQKNFWPDGFIRYAQYFDKGEVSEYWLEYEYYPNGNPKMIWEIKQDTFWNVLEYYWLDGTPFEDYGDFKDGEGKLIFLNDEGEACFECSFFKEVSKGKDLCD